MDEEKIAWILRAYKPPLSEDDIKEIAGKIHEAIKAEKLTQKAEKPLGKVKGKPA